MQFKDVIGHETIKRRLVAEVDAGRVPHAQLFIGPEGCGKMALVLACAQYLMCENRHDGDSCGECAGCRKAAKLIHPDIHFVFPTTTNKRVKKDAEAELFYEEWREYMQACEGYPDLNGWLEHIDVENKQGTIYVRDASAIIRKLSFKPYEGEYRIVIIWMAEKMNADTANKLLKLLEEPPQKTVIMLIAENPEDMLATVRSRTMLVKVPKIDNQSVASALTRRFGCGQDECADAVAMANGNWIEAKRFFDNAEAEKESFEIFRQWMRLCFKASVPELIDFVASIRALGRERQKVLLNYALGVFHNSVMFNSNLGNTVALPKDEIEFAKNFAPFVNEANVVDTTALFEEGIRQIERNGNAQLIFMDISLKMCGLLRKKKQ